MTKEYIAEQFQLLQDDICSKLEALDGKATFEQDNWQRDGGGGGRSRAIANGLLIEKGGVNFSAVHGELPTKIKEKLKLDGNEFFATGVSIVLHPVNPFVPIIHMNVRYFEIPNGDNSVWWFGGGIDVTPHYIDKEDASFFHNYLKGVCDDFDSNYYPTYKKWADDYFYIKHRKETRGIGGIFFDRLNTDKDKNHAFALAVGNSFVPIYSQLANQNRTKAYTEENLEWQARRRSRYVEFNLVWDKGTKFGLDTDGRTESILMSMPPIAQWSYNYQPSTKEQETMDLLKKDIDWIK